VTSFNELFPLRKRKWFPFLARAKEKVKEF